MDMDAPKTLDAALQLSPAHQRLWTMIPGDRRVPACMGRNLGDIALDRIIYPGWSGSTGLGLGKVASHVWYRAPEELLHPIGRFRFVTELGMLRKRLGSFTATYVGYPDLAVLGDRDEGMMYRNGSLFCTYEKAEKTGKKSFGQEFTLSFGNDCTSSLHMGINSLYCADQEVQMGTQWAILGFVDSLRDVIATARQGLLRIMNNSLRREWWEDEPPKSYDRVLDADIQCTPDVEQSRIAIFLMAMINMARWNVISEP